MGYRESWIGYFWCDNDEWLPLFWAVRGLAFDWNILEHLHTLTDIQPSILEPSLILRFTWYLSASCRFNYVAFLVSPLWRDNWIYLEVNDLNTAKLIWGLTTGNINRL